MDETRIQRASSSDNPVDGSLSSLVSAGPPVLKPDQPEHMERIGRYRVQRVLGEGGFGCVYLAEDETLMRQVAIKVPRLGTKAKRLEKEFLTEARQLAQLKHPGIVSVFDIGRDGEQFFIVSDFLSGPSLSAWLREHSPDWKEAAMICLRTADAFAHAHAHRTIHRDLKPANIIITEDGQPVIVDFGLAVSDNQRADGTERGEISGTPSYMSPEQAAGQGHRIDGRTDIYSLGVILYRMLTGNVPFRAESVMEQLRQTIEDEPQPPRQVARAIPAELERICLKALEKQLRDRYTTADDMADDLRSLLQQSGAPVDPAVAVQPGTQPEQNAGQPTQTLSAPTAPAPAQAAPAALPELSLPGISAQAPEPDVATPEPAALPQSDQSTEKPSTSVRRAGSYRRQVTIVNCSCDVYENDEILEILDAEEQASLLADYQSYCSEIAAEFGGSVLQEADDGVVVCFGFPIAFEDSVRRSIRMALAVRERMEQVNSRWSRQGGCLSSRATLHTGSAIAEASQGDGETWHLSIVRRGTCLSSGRFGMSPADWLTTQIPGQLLFRSRHGN